MVISYCKPSKKFDWMFFSTPAFIFFNMSPIDFQKYNKKEEKNKRKIIIGIAKQVINDYDANKCKKEMVTSSSIIIFIGKEKQFRGVAAKTYWFYYWNLVKNTPGFYYCMVRKGWSCKVCVSLASKIQMWLEIIQVEEAKFFWNLSVTKKLAVTYKLLQDTAIPSEIQETLTSRFKSFFRITF